MQYLNLSANYTVVSFPLTSFLMFTANNLFFRGLHTAFSNARIQPLRDPNCNHYCHFICVKSSIIENDRKRIISEVDENKRIELEVEM